MLAAARENIIETYFGLAATLKEATIGETDAFRYAMGSLPLTLCNFAIDLKFSLDPVERSQQLKKLHHISSGKRALRVFALSGDAPANSFEVMRSGGFRRSGRLALMATRGVNYDPIAVQPAGSAVERTEVAAFMVQNFFVRRETALRERIVRCTADSPHELMGYWHGHHLMGAMMVSRTALSVGVYNLCVAPRQRRKRLGRMLLAAAGALAEAEGKVLTLQSDRELAGWYELLGFESCGEAETFAPIGEIV
jgi:GNAT superfamily N-acetyltransferase